MIVLLTIKTCKVSTNLLLKHEGLKMCIDIHHTVIFVTLNHFLLFSPDLQAWAVDVLSSVDMPLLYRGGQRSAPTHQNC